LYVAEGAAGRISRVDLKTGKVTPYATGLPAGNPAIGLGGPIDLVFVGRKAYVLVTLVGPAVGGSAVDGIYRIDGPKKHKVIADIGTWATNNPPPTAFDLPTACSMRSRTTRAVSSSATVITTGCCRSGAKGRTKERQDQHVQAIRQHRPDRA
jgi:hypothetical protein